MELPKERGVRANSFYCIDDCIDEIQHGTWLAFSPPVVSDFSTYPRVWPEHHLRTREMHSGWSSGHITCKHWRKGFLVTWHTLRSYLALGPEAIWTPVINPSPPSHELSKKTQRKGKYSRGKTKCILLLARLMSRTPKKATSPQTKQVLLHPSWSPHTHP